MVADAEIDEHLDVLYPLKLVKTLKETIKVLERALIIATRMLWEGEKFDGSSVDLQERARTELQSERDRYGG